MSTTVTAVVSLDLTLSDGTAFSLSEGDFIQELCYLLPGSTTEETITGRLRAILGNTVAYTLGDNRPINSYISKKVRPLHLLVDCSDDYAGDLRKVQITRIKSIGNVIPKDEPIPDPDVKPEPEPDPEPTPIVTYTIKFIGEDGYKSEATVQAGSPIGLEPVPPDVEGYVFQGWSTDRYNPEYIIEVETYVPTGNMTLYAMYEQKDDDQPSVDDDF